MMEKGGINKLCIASRFVKSKCQDDQFLGLKLRNESSPFSDSIAPFRFGDWQTINGCGQKKSVSAAYQPSLDQSTTVRKTDTYVLLLSG